jgi:predicted transcriptional regulator
MKAKECMCGNVCYCTPNTKIADVAKMMNEKQCLIWYSIEEIQGNLMTISRQIHL